MVLCQELPVCIVSLYSCFLHWKHLYDSLNYYRKVMVDDISNFNTIIHHYLSKDINYELRNILTNLMFSQYVHTWFFNRRYMAVCHPYRHREYNSRFNVMNRIMIYTLPVLFFAIILNIPKFYETKVNMYSVHFKLTMHL